MKKFLEWVTAAGIRAIRTAAQTALSLFTVGQLITDIDWKLVASAAVVAGVYSMLMSIAGLPELKEGSGSNEH